ncbi:MAG: Flp pilus assembly protein TadD [Gammaproteobacteria bacterium]|nr:MAG: Flp pilus assembly protein TadD [Gammaproteobacteria bacterium]TND06344.1 MAG: Flp pilus assembly protein TadD [Gammaproteobacteria bacterium]
MKHKNIKTQGKKRQALELLQKKRLLEAKALYNDICMIDPRDAEAWFMQGVVNGILGLFDESARCSQQALAIRPDYFEACANLGNALRFLGRLDEAMQVFAHAIRLQPAAAEVHSNLGAVYFSAAKLDEAKACFLKAVALQANYADAWFNLGKVNEKLGMPDEAAAAYRKTLTLRPEFAEAHNSLGVMLQRQGDTEKALSHFEQALRLRPDHVEARSNLAGVFTEQRRLDEAIANYRQVLANQPHYVEGYRNLGRALELHGELDAARQCYQDALRLEPDSALAHNSLGNVLFKQDCFDEALARFTRAVQLKPDYAIAWFNEGLMHRELGRPGEALKSFNMALAADPELKVAHWDRALALLATGEFEKGWIEYEWGFHNGERSVQDASLQRWHNETIADHSLLVCAEQGIGDQIMFASCLPEAMERAAGCVIECEPRLVTLFGRSFPAATVVSRFRAGDRQWMSWLPPLDVYVPIGSLPRYFRRSVAGFPQRPAYLVADAQRRDYWRQRFNSLGDGLKVGISWRGGARARAARLRSTTLPQWQEILATPGVQFINVQYGDCRDALAAARKDQGVAIHHFEESDPIKDQDDFAAQLAALDLVISVDNATVHMAGALGVPIWTLLPFAAEWRWLLERDDSPWYPSMRLYRQPERDDWVSVFARVAAALRALAQR